MEILCKLAKKLFCVEICGRRVERGIEDFLLGHVNFFFFFFKHNFKGQKHFSATTGHAGGVKEGWLALSHLLTCYAQLHLMDLAFCCFFCLLPCHWKGVKQFASWKDYCILSTT